MSQSNRVDYRIEPSQYKHWSVKYDGEVATCNSTSTKTQAFALATS